MFLPIFRVNSNTKFWWNPYSSYQRWKKQMERVPPHDAHVHSCKDREKNYILCNHTASNSVLKWYTVPTTIAPESLHKVLYLSWYQARSHLLVSKSQQICCTPWSIAHHYWDRGHIRHVFQHCSNGVGTTFYHETHHWSATVCTCNKSYRERGLMVFNCTEILNSLGWWKHIGLLHRILTDSDS
jgi:hypothetical protein